MTTKDCVSTMPLEYKRGKHPNSKKNLRPGNPPVDIGKHGYSVTAEVKEILRVRERRQAIAETMVSESEAGNVPMIKELLDRTEGKVPGDLPPISQDNRVLIINVVSDRAKELVEKIGERLDASQ